MANLSLENNKYFQLLKTELKTALCKWIEPSWVVCVPEKIPDDFKLTQLLASSQALCIRDDSRSSYTSELFGLSLEYQIVGKDPRKIQWTEQKGSVCEVFEALITNEYLTTISEHVVHVLLTDRLLPSMIEEDESFLTQVHSFSVESDEAASNFLWQFRCHHPVLKDLESKIKKTKEKVLPSCNVDQIQCSLHNLILSTWEALMKRHLPQLQTNSYFQDLILKSLDFLVISRCHNELWEQITDRCGAVDQTVTTRINHLKNSKLYPVELRVSSHFRFPLPAAIVEMATLNGRSSALERLHCVRDSVELIEAQIKEAKALVSQYTDQASNQNGSELTTQDLLALMVGVIVQSRCSNIVANIYYLTHYVFSVSDETHALWRSLRLLRKCLELIMKLNITNLSTTRPLRKELSLQDLMLLSTEVESRFEGPQTKETSQSAVDITALDLQMHQLTWMLQQATQDVSETTGTLNESNSPSRKAAPAINSNPSSKVQSFKEFIASIPSTIRASFRRKQSEQRIAFYSSIDS